MKDAIFFDARDLNGPIALAVALLFCICPVCAMDDDSLLESATLLGSRLEAAKQTDFFNFFNLREHLVTLKPAAGDFGDRVTVNAHLDNRGRIKGIDLLLARSFIDDKRSAVFAGDIAKSFLRSAVPAADREAIEALATDIEFRHPRDIGFATMPLQPGAVPSLADQPSPGYRVYAGEDSLHEQLLSSSALRLENRQVDGVDALLISLRIEAAAKMEGEREPAAEQNAEIQDEYRGNGLFKPAEALEILHQAHWAAQVDSAGKFISSLRPRLCFLLLQVLEKPENEEYPLATARLRTPIELKLVSKAMHFRLEDAERKPLTQLLSAEEYLDLWKAAAAAAH